MKEFLIGFASGLFFIILTCILLLSGCVTVENDTDDSDFKPLKIELTDDGDVLIPVKDWERMQALFLYEKGQSGINASWKLKYQEAALCAAQNERMHFNTKQCFEDKI